MSIRKLMINGYSRLAFLGRFYWDFWFFGIFRFLSNPQAYATVTNFLFRPNK